MKNGVDENTVVALWQELVAADYEFTTDTRQTVKVRYGGKNGENAGADLRHVVLDLNGQTVKGDIEFHVHARDWIQHGHHRNPNYNNVILHVVMWRQSGESTFTAGGHFVPTIDLGNFYNGIQLSGLETVPEHTLPCRQIATGPATEFVNKMQQAGLERFRLKAQRFSDASSREDPERVLFSGLMEGLGYSQNRSPFRQLATEFFSEKLTSYCNRRSALMLEAFAFGTAGLLPSQRHGSLPDHTYVEQLEEAWQQTPHRQIVPVRDWTFFRQRPANFPSRRLAGMCHYLNERGLNDLRINLEQLILSASDGRDLLSEFTSPAVAYWQNHYDFGKTCSNLSPLAIGKERSSEIFASVVLPFFYQQGDRRLKQKTQALYTTLPAVPENSVVKHMRQQFGFEKSVIHTTLHQQGLLHLFKEYCASGSCPVCPVPVRSV